MDGYSLVSLVLPVYRQADHLEAIVRAYEDVLTSFPVPHETILVVNGPDDGSVGVAQRLEELMSSVRMVRREASGWGGAVRVGVTEARGDLICYTNSARTTADTLVLLLECALRFPGIVIKANRRTRDNVWRRLGSLIYNLECRALFDLSNFDINGTPKVFPRTCDPLLRLRSDTDVIDAEMLAICRRENYLVLEVPVIVTRRYGGVSTTTVLSAVRMYWGVIDLWSRMRRRAAVRGQGAR